jgi:hypothetical protein
MTGIRFHEEIGCLCFYQSGLSLLLADRFSYVTLSKRLRNRLRGGTNQQFWQKKGLRHFSQAKEVRISNKKWH